MNFLNRLSRRTKLFVTSTAVAHAVLATNPTPSVAVPARPLRPPVGRVATALHTAAPHVVTTINPTPSVANPSRPLPRRAGAIVTAQHTPSPHLILTTNPTPSVLIAARPLPQRAGSITIRDAAQEATSLVSETSPPPMIVKARSIRRSATIAVVQTDVPRARAGFGLSASAIIDAGRSARLSGRVVALRATIPPISTPSASEVRPDVISAASGPRRPAPQPLLVRTWSDDPQARSRPPRITRAALIRFAGLVAFTRNATPPEAIEATPVSTPHQVRPVTKPASGRVVAIRTAGTEGRLGQPSACEPAIVPAAASRRSAGHLVATAALTSGRAVPAPVADIVTPVRLPRRSGSALRARTATPPTPPSPVPVALRAGLAPRIAGRQGSAVHAPAFTVQATPTPRIVVAGKAPCRVAPRPVLASTAKVAAQLLTTPRPVPRLIVPRQIPKRASRVVRIGSPAGPTPTTPSRVVAPVKRAPSPGRLLEIQSRQRILIPIPVVDVVDAALLPRRPSRVVDEQTWIASPFAHGPIPRALIVPSGRWPKRSAPQPLWACNPISWSVTGLPPDLPAAVIAWLRLSPAIVTAFGETLTTTPPVYKLFGDWNSTKSPMPYLVYQELFEGPGNYQSPNSRGVVYGFPTGQFQISIFAAGKRQGRVLAEMVAASLNDAPLTFADGVLLELRLDSMHAIPEGDIGPGGVVTAYHFALTFLYRVQRSLTFTT
ncbi:MAG: hypothetical protein P4L84_02230 [Isosphaeraceae bacterium]|nr:hypothetical protein [Isosphaeraceae bacterium]